MLYSNHTPFVVNVKQVLEGKPSTDYSLPDISNLRHYFPVDFRKSVAASLNKKLDPASRVQFMLNNDG